MGYWGSVVLCRSESDMWELAALVQRDEGIERHRRRPGNWQIGWYPGAGLADDAVALLHELAAESGSPVLLGFVLDSDAVALEGFSATGGHWRACLARESARGYWEDDEEAFDDLFLSAEAATAAALRWARDAGAEPVAENAAEVFRVDSVEFSAELLFIELLDALGT